MFTVFSVTFGINKIAVLLLALLILYTLFLLAKGYISAQSAVRWILAELLALIVFVAWRYLPFFRFTSSLSDRELLLIVVVIFFALACFLMLDALVHISRLTGQVKTLAQESALLRLRLDSIAPEPVGQNDSGTDPTPSRPGQNVSTQKAPLNKKDWSALLWIMACGGFLYMFTFNWLPSTVLAFFTANYLE
jgi:hypothetical protein